MATEYPITARCDVPELKEEVRIPANYEITPTLLEVAQVQNCMCLHQDLSKVSPFLNGFVRESFLVDDAGLPCLTNFEAEWRGKTMGASKNWSLYLLSTDQEVNFYHLDFHRLYLGVRVCIDGILIAGIPGRPSYLKDSFSRLGFRSSPLHSSSPALINACGNLKPEITPRRTPPDRLGSDLPPGWKRLNEAFREGLGLLWEQLIDYIPRGLSPETFWKQTIIHNASVGWIPDDKLWEMLSVSLTNDDRDIQWRLVRDLGEMSLCHSGEDDFVLIDQQGWKVGPDSELEDWERQGEERPSLGWNMNFIVLLMSCLDIRDKKVILHPLPPSQSRVPLAQYAEYSAIGVKMFLIEYVGSVSDALVVQTPYPTANRNHPLVKLYHQSRFANEPTDLQSFARSFVPCISETLSTMKQTPTLDEPSYWQKRVGHLYFSVQWDRYDVSLQPPYTLWTEDRGYFSFGEKDFARWRDSPTGID